MSVLDTLISVFMVGHSLFGQTGPDMLQGALRAGQGQGTVQAQIINGAPLAYHRDNADQAQGARADVVLPEGAITDLILTEAVPLANHLQWSDSTGNVAHFAQMAVDANPDARIYIQETWHSLRSGTGVQVADDAGADVPWRQRLEDDLAAWETLVDAAQTVTPNATLIPAGQALAALSDRIDAGSVAGLDNIAALFDDDIHLNDLGHYFVAMVQYAVLTGHSPLGLPAQFSDRWGQGFDAPDPDLARQLQQVAWDAVQAYHTRPASPVLPPRTARAATAPAAPTGPPKITPAATPATDLPAGTSDVAIGLAPITDWSVQQPFLDIMKTARPWLGHRPGQFGGMEYEELVEGGHLDPNGWPLRKPTSLGSIGTLILTDLPQQATSLAGRYVLRFKGAGVVEVSGRATDVRYGKGRVTFSYTPGPGSVEIRLQRINPANRIRDITVVHADHARAFDAGAIFNPAWLARMAPFKALRMMDWMQTNNATIAAWEDRPRVDDFTYARKGVPLPVMLALASELQTDLWVNMPHLADDAYVTQFATAVRDGLAPAQKVYVEYSNEVWNWQFTQTKWADAQAMQRWGQRDAGTQFYALRAAQVAQIWSSVFGADPSRLVNVISTQTGWLGLEEGILNAPLVTQNGGAAPASAFDAYAVSGYFGGVLGLEDRNAEMMGWLRDSLAKATAQAADKGLTGAEAEAYIAAHKYDHASALAEQELTDGRISGDANDTLADLAQRVWPYHAAVAQKHGLSLIMYEGGTHIVGLGPQVDNAALTAFFQHLNYTPEMGRLYQTLLRNWRDSGGQLFNAYSDVYAPSKWGSWGALRHLDDANPRWDALVNFE